jgi:hypothetical protein
MMTSVRSGAFDRGDAWAYLFAPATQPAAPDPQKRAERLRELAREFRRILNECSVFDSALPETLRQVIADLEEEAAELERRGRSSRPSRPGSATA